MKTLSIISEEDLTLFHKNYFVLSLSDVDISAVHSGSDNNGKLFFSFDALKNRFPNVSDFATIKILVSALDIKSAEGKKDFLLVYKDNNKEESMDLALGLSELFNLRIRFLSDSEDIKSFKVKEYYWSDLIKRMISYNDIHQGKIKLKTKV